MARHRTSLRQRARTWWDEKSVHPIVLPIVWVMLSVLLLIGLALTIPPIIKDILEPDEPEVTQTPSPEPTEEQTIPPVLQAPEPVSTPEGTVQDHEPVVELPPAGPEPQNIPVPVVPQPQPIPVQPAPFVPQPVPQVPLPPVLPVPPIQPLPDLPEVIEPVVPPILQPVVEDPVGTVGGVIGGVIDGGGNLVDGTLDTTKDVVGIILP